MSNYHHNHICGCYYVVAYERQYLPQVVSDSHTIITPVSFATQLKQTFSNPSTQNLPKVRYTFPLYDGIAVSGYTITYADKTLQGIVKQKDVAKQIYQTAVDNGDTAGLLEALPASCFGVTLGNVPPGQDITVTITYCGELKHDSQIDGLRFNLPTSIAPRYGSYPGKLLESNVSTKGGISITVDINMLGSAIRKVQSPSHPLSVTMGQLSNTRVGDKDAFSSSQASATLTLGSVELAQDFVLQILADNIGNPQAVIETHPTLPNYRAIMTTLVPKFTLEQARPEVVFIADQSGSMNGSKNLALVAALKLFLKSLPHGVRFNICAFGNRFQFLWPKSVPYSEDNFNTAVEFVDGFSANFGGTELLRPIRETFERQLKGLSLEIMLLTDGQIWGENQVFDYINEQIRDKGVDARVFALGIGQEVSHTLVEGIARAGNGFAQFTQTETEDIDQKIIRMLKGALYAHTKDHSLEVHYESSDKGSNEDEDEFEIIDKVNDFLSVSETAQGGNKVAPEPKSFFDPSTDLDGKAETPSRYTHLPNLQVPAIIQAPAIIPPLFPFNRTNVYLLLGLESSQKVVSSITLRATSSEGPLELNIPVHATEAGTSMHHLAARKAIQDLEAGRGWLLSATVKDDAGTERMSVKEKYESRFDELLEREAVRLGETFCVAGKFTSFVAVSDHTADNTEEDETQAAPQPGYGSMSRKRMMVATSSSPFAPGSVAALAMSATPVAIAASMPAPPPSFSGQSGMMMMAPGSQAPMKRKASFAARKSAPSSTPHFGIVHYRRSTHGAAPRRLSSGPRSEATTSNPIIHQIISLQTFSGAWTWDIELLRLIGKSELEVNIGKLGGDKDVAATVLTVAYFETTLSTRKEVWELVVAKARTWLGKQEGGDVAKVEELILVAAEMFPSS